MSWTNVFGVLGRLGGLVLGGGAGSQFGGQVGDALGGLFGEQGALGDGRVAWRDGREWVQRGGLWVPLDGPHDELRTMDQAPRLWGAINEQQSPSWMGEVQLPRADAEAVTQLYRQVLPAGWTVRVRKAPINGRVVDVYTWYDDVGTAQKRQAPELDGVLDVEDEEE